MGGKTVGGKTMQAWQVPHYGPWREVLAWREVDVPRPTPGTALVRVGAAALAYALMLRIAGQYQIKDPLPFTPGFEAAGEVVAAGADCPFPVGTRLMGPTVSGAYAEYALLDCVLSRAVPESMGDIDAACVQNSYHTSWIGLLPHAGLKPGETLLVHGAGGGVGLAAVQIGKAHGARVIACVGGAEKAAVCRELGADLVIDHQREDFVQAVLDFTGGSGADVILDPVGGDVFDQSRRCIAFAGRLVVVGFASGRIPEIAANRVLLRNFSLSGFTVHGYRQHRPEVIEQAWQAVLDGHAAGWLRPAVSHVLPLARLPEAIAVLEARRAIGKVVVTP